MEQQPQTALQTSNAGELTSNPTYSTMLTDSRQINTLMKLAKSFSLSQIVPEQYQHNEANCFVACELANRMGVSPLVVMQSLYVVKGKPTWSGQACIALINGTRQFSPLKFTFVGERGSLSWGCYVSCTRIADGETLTGTVVDMRMAKDEGWLDKPGSKWKTMPEQMMQYRSAAFFARVYCPAALMGLQTAEEVQDVRGYDEPQASKTIVITMEDN